MTDATVLPTAAATTDADHRLVADVAAVVARPPVDPPDSFALHAALELGARYDLLAWTPAPALRSARDRIDDLARVYGGLATVDPPTDLPPAVDAPARLAAAIAESDVAGADAAATALAATGDGPAVVAATAEVVLPQLSAAGHGVIALDRLRRVPADDPVGATGLRLLARQAATFPDQVIGWHHRTPPANVAPDDGRTLAEVLSAPPAPGPRRSDFIFPMVHLVESAGLPAELLHGPLAGIDLGEATRTLLRTAAWSMLQDDPTAAPYGWTHCLTLPLAALGLAGSIGDPADAVAVAATYVLAFRATQGQVLLDPRWTPSPSAGLVHDAWHADAARRADLVVELAEVAAGHHDAHLVKYVDACRRATELDPEAAGTYLAAAAHLVACWEVLDA